MNLADFDRELAQLFDRPRAYHGPLELQDVAAELCALYLDAHEPADVVDSCDVMVWIGHGEDEDAGRWDSVERRLLRTVREHYADPCQNCGGSGEDERERRCQSCHGSGLERGPWYPRVIVGNCVVAGQRVLCGHCENAVCGHCFSPGDATNCHHCGVRLRAPLAIVEALRMSVAGAANDGVGGAA